jgi:lipoprotein Spr
MRRILSTLMVVFCMATASLSSAHARKISRTHKDNVAKSSFRSDSVSADSLIKFAQTLIGTRYRPACSDPLRGFDCSGFVNYVFKFFNFIVPRSSCEFISIGEKVKLEDAKPGDIILFTSPKKHCHRIGHVGIVLYNGSDDFKFIHSTSGKEYGVTITSMDKTYRHRFVQVIRVLKQNDLLACNPAN